MKLSGVIVSLTVVALVVCLALSGWANVTEDDYGWSGNEHAYAEVNGTYVTSPQGYYTESHKGNVSNNAGENAYTRFRGWNASGPPAQYNYYFDLDPTQSKNESINEYGIKHAQTKTDADAGADSVAYADVYCGLG